MSLGALWSLWDKFWFAQGSALPLAIFRILLGVLVLQVSFWIKPESTMLFGQHAVVSSASVQLWPGHDKFSLLELLRADDSWLSAAVFVLALSGACLAAGLFSRVSAFLVYAILLSLDARNPFALHDGIHVMYIMSFLLGFSRAGDLLSIDRWVRVKWWRKSEPAPNGSLVVQRLMQVQLALVYFSAFSAKLHNQDWMDGTAVYLATHWVNAVRFPVPFLFDHFWTAKLLNWGTLLTELSMFSLVWIRELRYPVLVVGILFHLALEWTFVIPFFQSIMIASYVVFLEPDDLSAAINWLKARLPKVACAPGRKADSHQP